METVNRLFIGFLCVALLLWSLVDAPRSLFIHGHRASALITGVTALPAIAFAMALARQAPKRLLLSLIPVVALILAGVVALTVHSRGTGVENLLVYASFLALLVAGASASWTSEQWRGVIRVTTAAIVISDCLYLTAVLMHGLGTQGVVAPRAFAALALLNLAIALGAVRLHPRRGAALAAAQVILLAASLSRTAGVAALAVVCASFLRRSWRRVALATGALVLVIACGLAASQMSHTLRERTSGGDKAIHIHGFVLNTEGRDRYWVIAWNYFLDSPVIGHGAGAASAHIVRYYPTIDHPHNDYLRILDDGGLVGGAVLIFGIGSLGRALWRRWQDNVDERGRQAAVSASAFLALLGIAVLMITDNVIVYDYVMAPLGLLIGTSLRANAERIHPPTSDEA